MSARRSAAPPPAGTPILLDVDNSPRMRSRTPATARCTSTPPAWPPRDSSRVARHGRLAVWSAVRAPSFGRRLGAAGFTVAVHDVPARAGSGAEHTILSRAHAPLVSTGSDHASVSSHGTSAARTTCITRSTPTSSAIDRSVPDPERQPPPRSPWRAAGSACRAAVAGPERIGGRRGAAEVVPGLVRGRLGERRGGGGHVPAGSPRAARRRSGRAPGSPAPAREPRGCPADRTSGRSSWRMTSRSARSPSPRSASRSAARQPGRPVIA